MVGKRIALIAGCFAVCMFASTALQAFEQQSPVLSQPVPTAPSVLQPDKKGLSLDEGPANKTDIGAGKGVKIPGLGKMKAPNLNFGLDLMYGRDGKDDQSLGFTNEPLIENDVTIMGKVKRRF